MAVSNVTATAVAAVCVSVAGVDPELSTILTGDWIGLWPVVNSNRHTQAWEAFTRAQQQQQEQQQQQQRK